jgi:hypothetical protein
MASQEVPAFARPTVDVCSCPFCVMGTDVAYLTDCCGKWRDVEDVLSETYGDETVHVCLPGRGCEA